MLQQAAAQLRAGDSMISRMRNCAVVLPSGQIDGIHSVLPIDAQMGDSRAQAHIRQVRVSKAACEALGLTPTEGLTVTIVSDMPGAAGPCTVGQVTTIPNLGHIMLDLRRAK